MLWKISWRNLWRNKRRSVIVLISIVIGVVALIFSDTLMTGMVHQMLYNQIGTDVGHIQVHRRGYQDNPILENSMENSALVEKALKENPDVQYFSRRIISFGLLSSSYNSSGVNIVGIEPDREQHITIISKSVIAGRYLSGTEREILISRSLAEKLEVELGDKVVAMASQIDGSVGSEVFRVVGIYRTFDSEFDKMHVYIPLISARKMLNLGDRISEFVAIVKDVQMVDAVRDQLRQQLPDTFEVLSFKEIVPLMVYQLEIFNEMMYIYYVIIGIALIFGIINTMLMSVFERIQEIGVLKAIGMPDRMVLGMVLLEAAILGLFGTVIGTGLGYLIYLPLSHSGIDLSVFSDSLNSFGVGSIIYPIFEPRILGSVFFFIPIFAVLGAIYPAIKAVRFEPVEAMRFV